MKKSLDGLIFDMDGILVDVTKSYREAIRLTASYFLNREVTTKEVDEIKKRTSMNNDWEASYALVNNSSVSYGKVKEYFQKIYLGEGKKKGLIDNERLIVKKRQLIKLKQIYKKVAIATGRPKKEAEYVLRKNKIDDIFDSLIALEDVKNGKPAPDCILLAMKKASMKRPVYIGDSPADIEAAFRANVLSIYVGKETIGNLRFKSIPEVVEYLL